MSSYFNLSSLPGTWSCKKSNSLLGLKINKQKKKKIKRFSEYGLGESFFPLPLLRCQAENMPPPSPPSPSLANSVAVKTINQEGGRTKFKTFFFLPEIHPRGHETNFTIRVTQYCASPNSKEAIEEVRESSSSGASTCFRHIWQQGSGSGQDQGL